MPYANLKLTNIPLVFIALAYVVAGTVGVISGGIWAGAGIAGAMLATIAVAIEKRRFPAPNGQIVCFVTLLLVVGGISSFFAIDPALSRHTLFKLTTILIPLAFFSSPALVDKARPLLRHLPIFSLLTVLALFILSVLLLRASHQFGVDSPQVTKLNRGFSYALLMYIPLFGTLWVTRNDNKFNKIAFFSVFLSFAVGLFLTHSRATQLGVALAVAVFLVARFAPIITGGALSFVTAISVAWPEAGNHIFVNYHHFLPPLPSSWFHRVEIWDYLYHRIIESPIVGYGIGNAHKIDWLYPYGAMYQAVAGPASHPHNMWVQLWSEMGVGGAFVGLAFFAILLNSVSRLDRFYRPFAYAAYAFAFCLLMSAYNFWTDSLWAALALTLFAFRVGSGARELKQS